MLNSKAIEKTYAQRLQPIVALPPSDNGGPKSSAPEPLRLVFLDVDGVLNSLKMLILKGNYPYHTGQSATDDTDIVHPESIDMYTVELVNRLCKVTDAKIVLSSSWRLDFDTYGVVNLLTRMGIYEQYIIGRTDDVPTIHTRGEEVKEFINKLGSVEGMSYLESNGLILEDSLDKLNVSSYVIIDDVQEFLPEQQDHLVLTDEYSGLTLRDTVRAGIILTGNTAFDTDYLMEQKDRRTQPLWM